MRISVSPPLQFSLGILFPCKGILSRWHFFVPWFLFVKQRFQIQNDYSCPQSSLADRKNALNELYWRYPFSQVSKSDRIRLSALTSGRAVIQVEENILVN